MHGVVLCVLVCVIFLCRRLSIIKLIVGVAVKDAGALKDAGNVQATAWPPSVDGCRWMTSVQ